MKKHLGWAIRMLIAAAGIGYILYTLNWTSQVALPDGGQLAVSQVSEDSVQLSKPPASDIGVPVIDGRIDRALLETGDPQQPRLDPSFMVVVGEARAPLLAAGLLVFTPVFFIGALRWLVLMRARQIKIGYGRTFRLTMAGQFFNLCMPGTTGGDVMKAYYAAKGTDQRADAVVSVAIDRVCGLVGLVTLVGLVGLFSLDDPLIRKLTIAMWGGLVALVVVAAVYTSPTIRSRIRLGTRVGSIPGVGLLKQLDALVAAYRNHLGALGVGILLSLPIHLCLASAMILAGYAIGVDRPLLFLLGAVPIVFILWSLPISGPLGLGPLDYVAVQLIISGSETTAQQAVVMFVAYRLYAVVLGLCGALALLGRNAPSAQKAEQKQQPEQGDA